MQRTSSKFFAKLLKLTSIEVLDVDREVDGVKEGSGGALDLPVCQLVCGNRVPRSISFSRGDDAVAAPGDGCTSVGGGEGDGEAGEASKACERRGEGKA